MLSVNGLTETELENNVKNYTKVTSIIVIESGLATCIFLSSFKVITFISKFVDEINFINTFQC